MTNVVPITITNKQILPVLENAKTMEFNFKCRSKGFHHDDYDTISVFSTSDDYLTKISESSDTIEYAYNNIIGETIAGKYLLDTLKPILNFEKYYTSGYDPKGFVSWHHDADILGYYIMLTYATGTSGMFKYRDTTSNEVMTVNDIEGWQAKGVKIGSSPDDIFWHCAITSDKRYTFLLHYSKQEDFEKAIQILND
jgi:hypothetical protein